MQKLFAGTFFLFNFIFCNFSYAQDLPKYFGVEFQISRGSKTLIKSNIITVEGAPGRLTAQDANGVVHKFDFELSQQAAGGDKIVHVAARLYEAVADQWVLRSEPQFGTYFGKKATLKMNGKAKDGEDSYELEANITALTEQQVIEKTGVVPTSITPCPDLTPNELITMMRTGAPTNNIQTTGCCTLYCYGSPIQQCCGVVFCCNTCAGKSTCCVAVSNR